MAPPPFPLAGPAHRIAFYAPMKPPTHPVPSGDRLMARQLMAALAKAGHTVDLASDIRAWAAASDALRHREVAREAAAAADRLIDRWRRGPADRHPTLWFTYHLYHKAPDWVGPRVAAALGIPYVVAEASRAAKQADGPYGFGFRAADAALRQADLVIAMARADRPGLAAVVAADRLVVLPPFLDDAAVAQVRLGRAGRVGAATGAVPALLAVAMMRSGDKERSYTVLAAALARLADRPWHLTLAGEGPARNRVLQRFDRDRVTAHGLLAPEAVAHLYAAADLYLWPSVNEAYGLALLEAQAAGLPAVAGRTGGVPDIVEDGVTGLLVPPEDEAAFAEATAALLDDPDRRAAFGKAAAAKVDRAHTLTAAAERLGRWLAERLPP